MMNQTNKSQKVILENKDTGIITQVRKEEEEQVVQVHQGLPHPLRNLKHQQAHNHRENQDQDQKVDKDFLVYYLK